MGSKRKTYCFKCPLRHTCTCISWLSEINFVAILQNILFLIYMYNVYYWFWCVTKDVTSVIYLRFLIDRFWIYSLPYRILRRTTRAARWRYKTSVSSPWPQTTLIVPYRAYWSTGRTTIHGWTRLSMTTIAGFTWKGTTWTTSPTVPGNRIKSFTVESLNFGVAQSSWNSWVPLDHELTYSMY